MCCVCTVHCQRASVVECTSESVSKKESARECEFVWCSLSMPILHQVNTYAGIVSEGANERTTDRPTEWATKGIWLCLPANTRSISTVLFSPFPLSVVATWHVFHFVSIYMCVLINCTDAASTISVLFGASKCSVSIFLPSPTNKFSASVLIL